MIYSTGLWLKKNSLNCLRSSKQWTILRNSWFLCWRSCPKVTTVQKQRKRPTTYAQMHFLHQHLLVSVAPGNTFLWGCAQSSSLLLSSFCLPLPYSNVLKPKFITCISNPVPVRRMLHSDLLRVASCWLISPSTPTPLHIQAELYWIKLNSNRGLYWEVVVAMGLACSLHYRYLKMSISKVEASTLTPWGYIASNPSFLFFLYSLLGLSHS